MLRHDQPVDFQPLHPHLDIDKLIEDTPNFERVWKVDCNSIDKNGLADFEKLVLFHVVLGGRPLVVEGFHELLDGTVFSEKWMRQQYSAKSKLIPLLLLPVSIPTNGCNSGSRPRPGQGDQFASDNRALHEEPTTPREPDHFFQLQ